MGLSDSDDQPRASPVAANIDSVRGLACLLVVALHVIGDAADNGMRLPMTSDWHYVMGSIEFLRMPLFTTLSGYLYASHRVTRHQFVSFWQKKIRRLGVPLIFVTTILWYLRKHAYDDTASLAHDLFFASGHLWYIQALIIIFVSISIADALFRPGFDALVLAGLAAIMLAQAGLDFPTFFSVNGATYLAPYFLFGILLREQPEWLQDPRSAPLALGVVLVVLTAQQFGLYGLTEGVTLLQLPAALAGMAFAVFLLQCMPRNRLLASIGSYSYTIYLWHIIASAATRGVMIKLGMTSPALVFGACFTVALAAPIALHRLARSIPLISVAVTGENVRRTSRSKRVASPNAGAAIAPPSGAAA